LRCFYLYRYRYDFENFVNFNCNYVIQAMRPRSLFIFLFDMFAAHHAFSTRNVSPQTI